MSIKRETGDLTAEKERGNVEQKHEFSLIQERGHELRNVSGFQRVEKAKGHRAVVPNLWVMTPLGVQ